MKKLLKIVTYFIIIVIVILCSFIIYDQKTSKIEYKIGEKNLKIPIFIYHDIVENDSQVEYDYMQSTEKTFEKQITTLINIGYKPITYKDLIEYKNGEKALPKKSFLITFDDGFKGVYKYAYKVAKKYNIPITSFVINYNVGTEGYYTWEEAREMDKSGLVSIYSHSMKHDQYDKYSKEDLLKDVEMSLNEIEYQLGHKVEKVFTYPYGLYNEEGRNHLENKQIIQNMTDNKINQSNTLNLYKLHRMYPLNDPVWKILLKMNYRNIRYAEQTL